MMSSILEKLAILLSHYCILSCVGGLNVEGEADSWDFGVGTPCRFSFEHLFFYFQVV